MNVKELQKRIVRLRRKELKAQCERIQRRDGHSQGDAGVRVLGGAVSTFTFEAKYAPGQSVTITALERPGRVTLVRIHEGGYVDYFVTWWDEGKYCSEWLPPWELAP